MLNNLKNALPLIAGALAGKQGVKVLQGDWAKTDCIGTIWLPVLPDNDPNARIKALGFVGHETAHISFTDVEVTKKYRQQKNPDTFFGMMNLLEDIRIEKLQKTRFPGVSDNLENLVKILVDEKVFNAPKEDSPPVSIMQNWMLCKLRHDLLNQHAMQPLLDECDVVFEKMLSKNMRIRLEALAYDVENAKSTLDVFNITASIMKMIEEEAKKEEEKEQEEAQQQQQEQSQQADSNQPADSTSPQDGGDTSDSSDAGNQDADGDDDAGQEANSSAGSAQDKQKMSDVLKGILGAAKSDQYEDIGDVLANQINDIKTKANSSRGVSDEGGSLRVFNASKQATKGRNGEYDFKARRAVNALKLKLHTMLQAQTMTSYQRSDVGARFSKRHLHEIKVGGKVFEKRTEGIDIDLAVSVLIDISVSMASDNKLEIAALSGYATAEAFASVHGVVSSVAIFPTANGVDYISSFGVKPVMNAENFAKLSTQGSTPLSDALSRVSIDLLQQPQARKIVLVITDGEPNHNDQSSVVIKAAENAGIEVMGVGIGVDLDHLFNIWCSINSVDDLPKSMFGILQNKLSFKKAA